MVTEYLYVLSKDGKALMPSKRWRHAKELLKDGKAKKLSAKPFVIQLLYDSPGYTDSLTLCIDPGRTNIGVSVITDNGTCVYQSKAEARNKEIPKLMSERADHRRASRNGRRKRRQRRAVHFKTASFKVKKRYLPHYETPIEIHDIKNKEARFCNRRRPKGWLTPTANQLLDTHKNLVKHVTDIMPVNHSCMEVNKFVFARMDNPKIRTRIEYERGRLFGEDGVHGAVFEEQGGHCIFCKKGIDNYHHIVPKSKNGSDTVDNLAGLCKRHHGLVHKESPWQEKLATKKAGLEKKYGALSIINQIMPYLVEELVTKFEDEAYFITGYETKQIREKFHLKKDHNLDAYCMGLFSLRERKIEWEAVHNGSKKTVCFQIKQYRRHDRQKIHHQTERTYKLDGVVVAKNRRKRIEQKEDSLHEWYIKTKHQYGIEEARHMQSRLTVTKSKRYYKTLDSILPGTTFKGNDGKVHVLSGKRTNGQYYLALGDTTKRNHSAKKCKIIRPNAGLVYV